MYVFGCMLTFYVKADLSKGRCQLATFSMMETISMMKILPLDLLKVMKNWSNHIATGHKAIHLNPCMKSLVKVIHLILGLLFYL